MTVNSRSADDSGRYKIKACDILLFPRECVILRLVGDGSPVSERKSPTNGIIVCFTKLFPIMKKVFMALAFAALVLASASCTCSNCQKKAAEECTECHNCCKTCCDSGCCNKCDSTVVEK